MSDPQEKRILENFQVVRTKHDFPLTQHLTPTSFGMMFSRETIKPRHPEISVVLVPGMIISSSYMIPLARQLAPYCQVHMIDFPGYGHSDKPSEVLNITLLADSVIDWMNGNRIEKSHFIANSFGCQVVADLGARYPERVDKIILQGPTVDPSARHVLQQAYRLKLNSWRESKSVGTISVRDYKTAGVGRVLKTIRLTLKDRIEEKLPLIRAKTLIVRGEKDPVVPQSWAIEATKLLPQGELRVIEGAAHTLNYSEPEKFAEVIVDFLGLRNSDA